MAGGKCTGLADYADKPALLVAFISNRCPFVVLIREALAEFARRIRDRGLRSSRSTPTTRPRIRRRRWRGSARRWRARLRFPYLKDVDQDVASAYGAACTPDFFLFDGDRRLAYHGQFDDARPGNGKTGDRRRPASRRRGACSPGVPPLAAADPLDRLQHQVARGRAPGRWPSPPSDPARRRSGRPRPGRPTTFPTGTDDDKQFRGSGASAVPEADVLVIGGGPAGAWAAIAAAEAGASVVLADKGYLGTSGATAPSNTGTWCVPPGEDRAQAVERRWERTGGARRPALDAPLRRPRLREPAAARRMGLPLPDRRAAASSTSPICAAPTTCASCAGACCRPGVTVLDHHPVLELLSDGEAVTGAAGLVRRDRRGLARARRRRRARDRRLRLLRAHPRRHRPDRRRLADGGGGRRFALGHGVHRQVHARARTAPRSTRACRSAGRSFYDEDGTPLLDADGEPLSNGIGGGREGHRPRAARRPGLLPGSISPSPPAGLAPPRPAELLPALRAAPASIRSATSSEVTLKAEGTVRGTGGIRLVTADCGTGVAGPLCGGRRREPRGR